MIEDMDNACLKRKARKSVGSLLVDVTIAYATDVLPLLRPHVFP